MSTNDQFDDIFREALPSVDVPPAPEMDWNAMAGLAKSGGAAAGGSASIWTATWVKVLGGAMALLAGGIVVWNSATVHTEATQASVAIATAVQSIDPSTVAPAETTASTGIHAITGTTAEPGIESANEALAPIVSNSAAGANNSGTSTRKRTHTVAALEQNLSTHPPAIANTTDEGALALDDVQVPGTDHTIDATSSTVTTEGNPAILEHADGSAPDPISSGTEALNVAAPSAEPSERTPAVRFTLDRASTIDLLRHGPPLIPLAPSDPAATTGPAFARFSLAPWVAVSNSIFSDPNGTANDDHLAQLSGGREMLGTLGLRAQYNVDQRLALLLGVQYTNKGSLQGRLPGTGSSYTYYAWSGRGVEVPIAIRYAFPREGKEFYARLGGTLQFNARGGTDRVVQYDAMRKEMSTLVLSSRSMGAAIDLGVGVQFRIARGIGLFIEPSYQYGLAPVVKYPSFKTLPYNPVVHSISLGTGLVFQFPHR